MSALTYGWNGPKDSADSFWVAFEKCTREPKNWKEEVYAAAREIAKSARKPIWLCSSGGIASEVMCRAFFDQGIRFSVLTIDHEQQSHRFTTELATRWSWDRAIEQRIVKLDMKKFVTDGIQKYVDAGYVAFDIFRFFQLKMLETVEEMGGYAVIGDGSQQYEVSAHEGGRSETMLAFRVGLVAPSEWCTRNNAAHEPAFFSSTPEMYLAFMRHPLVASALQEPDVFLHPSNTYYLKKIVHLSAWPDIVARRKYYTFERAPRLRREKETELKELFGSRIQKFSLPVSRAFEQLQK